MNLLNNSVLDLKVSQAGWILCIKRSEDEDTEISIGVPKGKYLYNKKTTDFLGDFADPSTVFSKLFTGEKLSKPIYELDIEGLQFYQSELGGDVYHNIISVEETNPLKIYQYKVYTDLKDILKNQLIEKTKMKFKVLEVNDTLKRHLLEMEYKEITNGLDIKGNILLAKHCADTFKPEDISLKVISSFDNTEIVGNFDVDINNNDVVAKDYNWYFKFKVLNKNSNLESLANKALNTLLDLENLIAQSEFIVKK